MTRKTILLIIAFCCVFLPLQGQERSECTLTRWEFRQDHDWQAAEGWECVEVPHDWAIYGPFSRDNDLQTVAVIQNGESVASVKTGKRLLPQKYLYRQDGRQQIHPGFRRRHE